MGAKKNSAFTIVEVVVVISVVAILSALAIVTFTSVRQDARDATRQGNATIISEALEKYYDKNGEYPSVASITNDHPGNTGPTVASKLSVPVGSLVMPNTPDTTTNAITSSPEPESDSIAYIAHSAEDNPSCQDDIDGGCDQFTLQYQEESTGDAKTIASRRSSRVAAVKPELEVHAQNPTTITATWSAIPNATSYELQRSLNGDMSSVTSTPLETTDTTISGLTPNTEYFFRVRAFTAGEASQWSDVQSDTTSSVSPPTGTITIAASMSGSNARGTAGGGSCEAGTIQYQIRYRENSGGWSSYTTVSTRDVAATEGYQYTFQAQARCQVGGVSSPWKQSSTASVVRPVSAPSGLTISASIVSTSWARGAAGGGSCAAGTTIQRQIRYLINSGSWSGWSTRSVWDISATSGYRYYFQQQARCVGQYASSGFTASSSNYVVRPVAQPSTPTISASIVSTSYARGTAGGASCPAGTSTQRQIRYSGRSDSVISYAAWSTRSVYDVAANQGWRYVFQQQARCVGLYASSSWRASSTASTVRPITAKHRGASVSVSTSGSYTTFTMTANTSCPTGTTAYYVYRHMSSPGNTYPNSWNPGHPDYGNPPHNWNVPGSTSRTMTWYTAARNRKYHVHYQTYCRTVHHSGPWMTDPDGHAGAYYRP